MDIQVLKEDHLAFVSHWLAQLNDKDDHYIAWLESEPEAIKAQLYPLIHSENPHAFVAFEQSEMVGFIGLEPFEEETVGRLLGPFAYGEHAPHTIEELWNTALSYWKGIYSQVKVAFFEQNRPLVQFCEGEGFQLYNREKNLILPRQNYKQAPLSPSVVPYEGSFEKLEELHPSAAFFNAAEMTHLIQDPHFSLWCYKEKDQMKGYLFFEQIEGMDEGEICFLQVEDTEQGQGIGSALIQYACHHAFQEAELSIVTVPVRASNPHAERLYKDFGFTEHTTIVAYSKEVT
ncbi:MULTISPECIES: GNAT family N-acetyltransferase [Pontibacillus]|uniref:GNAT family N-acetyltransferase n=1 Tax=Pontibacillus chungwhensis TaxID=265426 RepID=A0ABY8V242_9BACI|nr:MULTISPECIES: GNAT family N-acetyltransferase [Pontibacillus]MCD5323991.1 GNAT family N-acetyltransferase [Pontibacillus sp. HN14]WIF97946.1 GNAT family N-acetyltransferase [Pontibacillus chungwhensis]